MKIKEFFQPMREPLENSWQILPIFFRYDFGLDCSLFHAQFSHLGYSNTSCNSSWRYRLLCHREQIK